MGKGGPAAARLRRVAEDYRSQSGRGRRRQMLTPEQRQAIARYLRWRPRMAVRELRRHIPGLPRNSALAYVRRWRRVRRKRRRRRLQRLGRSVHGAVWAIDGTWFAVPVESLGRRALVVVELHTKGVLALRAVPGEKVREVVSCLRDLVAQHGAPLVLKLDNGPGFIAHELACFCREHGITLLFSPARRPSYNGTCEVSVRWSKARAFAAAAARGEPGRLLRADLESAVTYQGMMPRIDLEQRERFLAAVNAQRRCVAAEWGLARDGELAEDTRRSLERVAVQRALEICHILTIEGRAFRWSLQARKVS